MSSTFHARYETLAKLGSGGMATVHVGRQRGTAGSSRLVAIKRAHDQMRDAPELAHAMKTEAQLAAKIHHANVVGVLDVLEDDGEMVLVLEYVEGPTLADLVRRVPQRSAPRAMLRILLDAAAGLDSAHHATDEDGRPLALVHRDVSPGNVLVGRDGVAKITDFGVAKSLERNSNMTATGVLKGKLAYMAPEYLTTHHADARSDQFSLAVVVWESLLGERLFKGGTEVETLMRIASLDVPRLSSVAPELSALDETVARALSRDPQARFASVGAFASELASRAASANLVGSHAEVSSLVEKVFGKELDRRRFDFRATAETAIGQLALPEMWLPQSAEPEPKRAPSVRPPPAKAAVPASSGGKQAVLTALVIVAAAMGSGALLAGIGGSPPPPVAADPAPTGVTEAPPKPQLPSGVVVPVIQTASAAPPASVAVSVSVPVAASVSAPKSKKAVNSRSFPKGH